MLAMRKKVPFVVLPSYLGCTSRHHSLRCTTISRRNPLFCHNELLLSSTARPNLMPRRWSSNSPNVSEVGTLVAKAVKRLWPSKKAPNAAADGDGNAAVVERIVQALEHNWYTTTSDLALISPDGTQPPPNTLGKVLLVNSCAISTLSLRRAHGTLHWCL